MISSAEGMKERTGKRGVFIARTSVVHSQSCQTISPLFRCRQLLKVSGRVRTQLSALYLEELGVAPLICPDRLLRLALAKALCIGTTIGRLANVAWVGGVAARHSRIFTNNAWEAYCTRGSSICCHVNAHRCPLPTETGITWSPASASRRAF